MRTNAEIKTEIKAQFGFVPALFESVQESPLLFDHLWQQMSYAYTVNPLPILFKEKLLTYLSRFCQTSYCVVVHSCALRPLGMSGLDILTLLTTSVPNSQEITAHLDVLNAQLDSLLSWPESGSTLDEAVFFCAVLMYLRPRIVHDYQGAMQRILKPNNYNHLISFLSFVKMYHNWAEAHPNLPYEQDERARQHLQALLEEAPSLSDFFEQYVEQVATEMQSHAVQAAVEQTRQQMNVETQLALQKQEAYNRQLHALTRASLAIDPALPFETLLQVIANHARRVLGTHLAYISVIPDESEPQGLSKLSLSKKLATQHQNQKLPELEILTGHHNKPTRLTTTQLNEVMSRRKLENSTNLPLKGLLAVPLIGRSDETLGTLVLSDKERGEFEAEDEAVLIQLSQMAAAAIQNARLYEDNRQRLETHEELDQLRDQFLSIASHELRTPLTSIKGFAQVLERNLFRMQQIEADPTALHGPLLNLERQGRILGNIIFQANRLIGLVEEMLDISHIESGQLRLRYQSGVNLVSLVGDIVNQQQDISLNRLLEFEASLPEILMRIDEARIEQVVSNLITNALKYSPADSTVRIGISYELPPAHEDRTTSKFVRVWVQDRGSGISLEQQPHIFEQYYRVRQSDDPTTEGLGLGLYISREIINRHGGQLWVDSTPNEGSTFSFTLPLN